MPVHAHSRPLLDERRPGGFGWCRLGRASVRLDRAASRPLPQDAGDRSCKICKYEGAATLYGIVVVR